MEYNTCATVKAGISDKILFDHSSLYLSMMSKKTSHVMVFDDGSALGRRGLIPRSSTNKV